MIKKFVALCSIVIAFSLCFAAFSVSLKAEKADITTANMQTYGAEKNETTASGALGSVVGGVIEGIGSNAPSGSAGGTIDKLEAASDKVDNALGGVGDTLSGLGEGYSNISGSLGNITSGDIGSGIGDALGSVDGSALGDIGSGVGDALGNMDGSALGGVGSGLGDALSGIGSGALSGLGGVFGGAFGGTESTTAAVVTTVPTTNSGFDAGLIIPVPAATQITTEETEAETQAAPTSDESTPVGETVDYAATSNPYTKPTATFVAGDEDESIKWLQWIFVYTGYGLSDNGITGVLDEDTVAAVKKLQKENKLDIDGNITEEVIKAAEELYYKVVLGGDVNAIEIPSQATTLATGADGAVDGGTDDRSSVILLIVLLVVIWGFAIGGIVLVFVMKKKKIAAQKAEQAKPEEKNEASQAGAKETVSSISDLFEEAEKNSK